MKVDVYQASKQPMQSNKHGSGRQSAGRRRL